MYVIWLLALALVLPSAATAGEKGKLVSLLADYTDLRERVQEVREARKSGYSSDSKALLALSKEIFQAREATDKFRAANHKIAMENKADAVTSFYMIYAYDAMSQMVQAEIDRNLYLPDSDVPLRLAAKYEEIWKMIDPSISTVSIVPAK